MADELKKKLKKFLAGGGALEEAAKVGDPPTPPAPAPQGSANLNVAQSAEETARKKLLQEAMKKKAGAK